MKLSEYKTIEEKSRSFDRNITINTLNEFEVWYIATITEKDFVFRGVNEAKYKIYTSAQREWLTKYSTQIEYFNYIKAILNYVKENNLLGRYLKSMGITTAVDLYYLSLMQHFHAPSMLLDFSHNLDVALFFSLDNMQYANTDNEIDDYFSIYYFDKKVFKYTLNTNVKQYNFFVQKATQRDINAQEILSLDTIKKIKLSFVESTEKESIKIKNRKGNVQNIIFSNLNIIAQDGCFLLYYNTSQPLEKNNLSCVNIHKSLGEHIRSKKINDLNKDVIYPTFNNIINDSYNQFKVNLK